jgi:hypothetical protein
MTALARRTDPQSSHEAARQMTLTGMGFKQREEVLDLVRRFPGHTSLELAALPCATLDRYQIARRTAELAKTNQIRAGATRTDYATGRPSVTWYPI